MIKLYFKKVKIRKVSENFKEVLNAEISTEELFVAISVAKLGRAPGPDGYTSNFLKYLEIN